MWEKMFYFRPKPRNNKRLAQAKILKLKFSNKLLKGDSLSMPKTAVNETKINFIKKQWRNISISDFYVEVTLLNRTIHVKKYGEENVKLQKSHLSIKI